MVIILYTMWVIAASVHLILCVNTKHYWNRWSRHTMDKRWGRMSMVIPNLWSVENWSDDNDIQTCKSNMSLFLKLKHSVVQFFFFSVTSLHIYSATRLFPSWWGFQVSRNSLVFLESSVSLECLSCNNKPQTPGYKQLHWTLWPLHWGLQKQWLPLFHNSGCSTLQPQQHRQRNWGCQEQLSLPHQSVQWS